MMHLIECDGCQILFLYITLLHTENKSLNDQKLAQGFQISHFCRTNQGKVNSILLKIAGKIRGFVPEIVMATLHQKSHNFTCLK